MKKSFTLIELLIVIIIIGVLAALALASYKKVAKNAEKAEIFVNLSTLRKACEAYLAEKGNFADRPDLRDLNYLGTDIERQKQNIRDINAAFGTNLPTEGKFFYVFDRCDVPGVGGTDWDEINLDYAVYGIPYGKKGDVERLVIFRNGKKVDTLKDW